VIALPIALAAFLLIIAAFVYARKKKPEVNTPLTPSLSFIFLSFFLVVQIREEIEETAKTEVRLEVGALALVLDPQVVPLLGLITLILFLYIIKYCYFVLILVKKNCTIRVLSLPSHTIILSKKW
jgi:hypothetical protein